MKSSIVDLQLKFGCDQLLCSHVDVMERNEVTARTRNQRMIQTMRNRFRKLLLPHHLRRKRRVNLRARKVPPIRQTTATVAMEATVVKALQDLAHRKAKVRTAIARKPVVKLALMVTTVRRMQLKQLPHKDRLQETMGRTVHLLHQMQLPRQTMEATAHS